MRQPCAVIGAFAVGVMGETGSAETVALAPTRDNSLFSTGATSNGAGVFFFSGRTGPAGGVTLQRGVLAFDVRGAVPPGSTVTSAALTLELVGWSLNNEDPQTHSIHRLLADWGEGTSESESGMGAPATPGDATWLHRFFPGQLWASPGADFNSAPSASQTVISRLLPHTWGPTPQMVADVQCWLDDPGCNSGWLIRGNELENHTVRKFASREWSEPAQRPVLTIEFTPPCPGDLDDDGAVAIADLLQLLPAWGGPGGDVDGDGVTAIGDLLALLAAWGPCAG